MIREFRITDIDNAQHGSDVGYVWSRLRENPSHPAWEAIWREAATYTSLVRAWQQPTLTDEQFCALDEAARERYFDVLDVLDERVRDITDEVVIMHDLWPLDDEVGLVHDAVRAGLQAAELIFRSFNVEVSA